MHVEISHINYHQVHSYTQRPVISKSRKTLRIILNDQHDCTEGCHLY
jgi:hypothetical protein